MSATRKSAIFDINSDDAFFGSLRRTAEEQRARPVKDTERVLYLLMGLNHLRDWIAPGFNPKKDSPATPEQQFYVAIFGLPEFKIVNALCNHSKHMGALSHQLQTTYGAMFDDYPDIDSVHDFDLGPPLGYSIDGRNLFEITGAVIDFYKTHWYRRQHP